MKRPSMLKSQRRRSLSPSDKQDKHKRFGITRKLKMYIPQGRVEKLKVEKIPCSVPDKLVIVSNYEGNGFRYHNSDIAQFNTTYEVKKQIFESLKKLNKQTYKVWADKKIPLENKKFKYEQNLIYFLMFLLLALTVILIQMDEFRTIHPLACTVSLVGVIMSIVVGTLVVGFSSLIKKYSEDSLETDIKNVIRKNLEEFNEKYYLKNNLVWKVNVDFLWVSLNHNRVEHVETSEASSQHYRRDTEEYLVK